MQTSTVMFIPSTRGGMLTKMMRDREFELSKIIKFKVKMQEAGGIQLARLFSSDLARGESSGREDCHPCRISLKRPNCKQSSILYESKCVTAFRNMKTINWRIWGARYPMENSPNFWAPGQSSRGIDDRRVILMRV